jgi:hypothetical protein
MRHLFLNTSSGTYEPSCRPREKLYKECMLIGPIDALLDLNVDFARFFVLRYEKTSQFNNDACVQCRQVSTSSTATQRFYYGR